MPTRKTKNTKKAVPYLLEGVIDCLSMKPSSVVYPEYAHDPINFIHDILGIAYLTDAQKELCISVRDNKVTNVQAAHGVGKSASASWLVFWYTLALQGVAYTTAPTRSQVYDVLWKEVRKQLNQNPKLKGLEYGQTFFRVPRTQIEASGFTARDYDLNSIQGRHAERQIFIEDEAGGITQEIDGGISSCLSDDKNRLLRIGNPVPSGTAFHKNCIISTIKIAAWSHPNISWAYTYSQEAETHVLKDELAEHLFKDRRRGTIKVEDEWPPEYPRAKIPGAISIAWVEELRVNPLRGPGTPYWLSRVDGEFATDADDVVIPQKLWDRCRNLYDENPEEWDEKAANHDWRLGVDVADGGNDDSVIALWRGPVLYGLHVVPTKKDLYDQARLIAKIKNLLIAFPGIVQVDGTGVGSSLAGNLMKEGVPDAHKVLWGSRKDLVDPDGYANQKAEDFFVLKQAMMNGEVAIATLGKYEAEAKNELCDYRAYIQLSGKFCMEKKEETIARQGHSPDKADAIVVGFTENVGNDGGYKSVQTALDWLNNA